MKLFSGRTNGWRSITMDICALFQHQKTNSTNICVRSCLDFNFLAHYCNKYTYLARVHIHLNKCYLTESGPNILEKVVVDIMVPEVHVMPIVDGDGNTSLRQQMNEQSLINIFVSHGSVRTNKNSFCRARYFTNLQLNQIPPSALHLRDAMVPQCGQVQHLSCMHFTPDKHKMGK